MNNVVLPVTAEQEARDMLERMGVESAHRFSAGDVVELANLIAAYREVVAALGEARTADDSGWCQDGKYITEVIDGALDTAKRLGVE